MQSALPVEETKPESPLIRHPDGRDVFWVLLLMLLLILVTILTTVGLMTSVNAERNAEPPAYFIFVTLGLQSAAFVVPVFVVARWRGWSVRSALGFAPAGAAALAIGIVATLATGSLLDFLIPLLQQAIGAPVRIPGADLIRLETFSWGGFALMLLFAGIVAPVAEEMLFRGVLFSWLRQRVDWRMAALISSLAFGLFHVHWDHILASAVLGFVFAALYQYGRSIWVPIGAHVINNCIAIAAVQWLYGG